MRFEANAGQTDPRVRFLSRGPGYTLFITDDEMVWSIAAGGSSASPGARALRMSLAGARAPAAVTRGGELPGRSHYFIRGDATRWRTGVPAYERVTLEQVYDGIDLALHGSQQQAFDWPALGRPRLEYDFIVRPGADPGVIRLDITGADRVTLDEAGNLVLRVGELDLVQQKPVVYQNTANGRAFVGGTYMLDERGRVRFAVDDYDLSAPLVIDPIVTLGFASFLGGNGTDIVRNGGIAVDRDGNLYVAGDTLSTNFPLVDAIQTDQGDYDMYITKIAADGSRIVYSTYFGGAGNDEAHDIAVNALGEVWVAGFTQSVDNAGTPLVNEGFPLFNAFQPTFGGGLGDAAVVKLTETGALALASYLGGGPGGYERAHAMTLDADGNVYITGLTSSTSGFATPGVFQPLAPGGGDAWVAKITAAGAKERLTYLGGSQAGDLGFGIAVDRDGYVYVTGRTSSYDNAATPAVYEGFPILNAFQPTHGSPGLYDAFVTKLTPDLGALVYSSYLGGNHYENNEVIANGRAGGIVVDGEGHAWLTGHTQSTNFPSINALRPHAGGSDIFVVEVAADGGSLLFSTHYGSSGHDFAQDIAMDARGSLYVAAQANSGAPVVNGLAVIQPGNINLGWNHDAFVIKLSPSRVIEFATYLGGSSTDFGMSVAADDAGAAYLFGGTYSSNFPVQSAFQPACASCAAGALDAFVAKLFVPNTPPASTADVYGLVEDAALTVAAPGVLANDTDDDGDSLTAVLVSGPVSGGLVLNADGSFDYTPLPNFNGVEAFSYRADDGRALGNIVTVTIAVTPVNDSPTADSEGFTVEQETPLPITLMAADVDGDALTVAITDPPDHGSLSGSGRDVVYTGNGGYAGPDAFEFQVSDGVATASATITLNVTGASVADGYSMRTHARGVSTIDQGGQALAADLATGNLYVSSRGVPCGCPMQYAEVGLGGSVTFIDAFAEAQNSAGSGIAFDPYVPGGIISANENFRIAPRISRIDIAARTEAVLFPMPWVLNPLGNGRGAQQFSIDPANPHLLYFWDTTTSKLYRLNRATNALDEILALNQTDADGQPIADGNHDTNSNDIVFDPSTGTILLSDYPSRSILEIDPRTSPASVQVLYSNLPAGTGPIALDGPARRIYMYLGAIYAGPRRGGALSLVATNVGVFDLVVGRASSGVGRSLYALDHYRNKILEIHSLNTPPVAANDVVATDEDVAVEFAPLANDTDENGDVLSIALADAPANGTAEVLADGRVRYMPAPNWNGTDRFTYRASDGSLESDPATIVVTVNPVNDLPLADAGGPYTVAEGSSVLLSGSGSDLETAVLSYAWDLDNDGNYETAGADVVFSAGSLGGPALRTVMLRVSDEHGGTATDTAVVTVENVAPAGSHDAYAVDEDATLAVVAPGVLANDTDVDPLAASLVTGPTHGILTLNADGAFTYSPAANFSGGDSFVYRAHDGLADSGPILVTLTVNAVNDPPVATPQTLTGTSGSPLNVTLSGTDIDGDTLSFSIATPPANGSLSGLPPALVYTPNPGFSGMDGFTFTASDGQATSAPALVTLDIAGVNAPPDARDDAATVAQVGGPWTLRVLANDTSAPDAGETLTVIAVTQPAHGTAMVSADGQTVVYTNERRFAGVDEFSYTISDGNGGTDTAVVVVTVERGRGRGARADLRVGMADSPDPTRVERALTYRVNVHNNGPSGASGVVARVGLPVDTTFMSIQASQGTCEPTGECDLGDLAAGADASITLVVIPQRATETLRNTASVTADEPDPNRANNTASTITRVWPRAANLLIRMTDTPDPVRVGETLTYQIDVRNEGPDRSPQSRIDFEVLGPVAFVSAGTSRGPCGPPFVWTRPDRFGVVVRRTSVSCNLGELAAGGGASATLAFTPESTRLLQATAEAWSSARPVGNGRRPPTARTTTTVRR